MNTCLVGPEMHYRTAKRHVRTCLYGCGTARSSNCASTVRYSLGTPPNAAANCPALTYTPPLRRHTCNGPAEGNHLGFSLYSTEAQHVSGVHVSGVPVLPHLVESPS